MRSTFLHGLIAIGQEGMALLKDGRFRLAIRRKFFTQGVVKPWNRLPREFLFAPSMEVEWDSGQHYLVGGSCAHGDL